MPSEYGAIQALYLREAHPLRSTEPLYGSQKHPPFAFEYFSSRRSLVQAGLHATYFLERLSWLSQGVPAGQMLQIARPSLPLFVLHAPKCTG